MSELRFIYRISVNNNFRGLFGYLEFKKFGPVSYFNAFSGNSTGPNDEEDSACIGIYLNKRLYCLARSKAGALEAVQRLVSEAPTEARKDLQEAAPILFKVIG